MRVSTRHIRALRQERDRLVKRQLSCRQRIFDFKSSVTKYQGSLRSNAYECEEDREFEVDYIETLNDKIQWNIDKSKELTNDIQQKDIEIASEEERIALEHERSRQEAVSCQ